LHRGQHKTVPSLRAISIWRLAMMGLASDVPSMLVLHRWYSPSAQGKYSRYQFLAQVFDKDLGGTGSQCFLLDGGKILVLSDVRNKAMTSKPLFASHLRITEVSRPPL
jgi:hypothetical protein